MQFPGNNSRKHSEEGIVHTGVNYTYEILVQDIIELKTRFPFIETGSAGKSVLGRNLYYIKFGTGRNQVFYNGVHHSLEWITAPLLMKFAERFLGLYVEGMSMRGYKLKSLWNKSSFYIMPMVNPDGVDLVLNGLRGDHPYYKQLLQWNKGSSDFSNNWQANVRGVDLNHNYPAKWEEAKAIEALYGINGPGPTRYCGPSPLSEPESQAVVNFTRSHDFRLVLAFHSQGRVIYWNYDNMGTREARRIGELLSKASGYELDETTGIASYSGYKDWFIQEYGRPGYTIEVGLGQNPLPLSQFDWIYDEIEEMLLMASIV